MIGLLTIVGVGLLLGMRHATDPDHVIAVGTILSREHSVKRSALIGAAWGIGHTLTILVVGGGIIVFRITLPPRVGLAMEMAVGVMLIVLGIKNLGGLLTWSAERGGVGRNSLDEEHAHYHSHGDYIHAHHHADSSRHPHDPQRNPVGSIDRWFKRSGVYQPIRPVIVGTIHGLAGSAAIALLVLGTIRNLRWALAYLTVFGIGTILGMMSITVAIGSTFAYTKGRFAHIGRHFGVAAGLISLAFGVFIAYQIGFVSGLLTSHPNWVPH